MNAPTLHMRSKLTASHLIMLLVSLFLSACGSLTDGMGVVVMEASSFGRDLNYVETFEAEYDEPIDASMIMPGWIIRTGMPLDGIKKIKASRTLGSKGNVGNTAAGVAKLVDAGSDLSPL